MLEKIDCRPSVRGEIKKARHSGYDFFSSIFEFIDNACDTDCQNIRIELKEKKEHGHVKINKLILSDDAPSGISHAKLQSIFSWTYERERTDHDIGEFGTGFKSASVNLGNTLSVLTLDTETQKYYKAIADWYEMEESNRWDPKILEITKEFFQDYHPYAFGTSFMMENLRHEFVQKHQKIEKLVEEVAYHYKYFLRQHPLRSISLCGIFLEGKKEIVLSGFETPPQQSHFFYFFDTPGFAMESKIYVYRDQAQFYNFFILRKNNPRIELIEFIEKRKNGNSHLRSEEVSNRVLASMTLVDELLFRSCYYEKLGGDASEQEQEISPPPAFGTVDLIQNHRIVGRDLNFRKPRQDSYAQFIKHEVWFQSKTLHSILGIRFNKKSNQTDTDIGYTMEFLQMYHEKEIIRWMNREETKIVQPSVIENPLVNYETVPVCEISWPNSAVAKPFLEHYEPIESIKETAKVRESIPPSSPQPPPPPPIENVVESLQEDTQEDAQEQPTQEANRRKNFSLETKLQIIKKQECRDSVFDFLLKDEVLPLDYDHKNDRTNNSEDNCQALCVISHAIKSRKPDIYKKITENKESYIIDLLNCLTSSKIFLTLYAEEKIMIRPHDDLSMTNGIFILKK
jgi:hypothetical protein